MAKDPVQKGRLPRAAVADMSLLSKEEKAAIFGKAKAKVDAKRKADAEDAYLAQQMKELERGAGLDESMHEISLDLPEYADRLNIDGVVYFHGRSYTVGQGLYNVLREQMQRMWGHQDEIDGKRSDPRKPTNRVMNRHGVVNTTGSLRV